MHLFIFGYGYSASAFVDACDRQTVTVEGVTVRSREKALAIASHGLKPLVFDGERPAENLALVEDLCNTMKFGSLCALGGFTPYPVMSAIRHFPEDFHGTPMKVAAE